MTLKGKGRVYKQQSKVFLYFPKDISSDSQFPLEEGDVDCEVKDGTVIIKPLKEKA